MTLGDIYLFVLVKVIFLLASSLTADLQGGGGGKGGVDATPSEVFLVLFLDDQASTTDVFCSCLFILRAHFDTRLVMISFYGYEIWCQTKNE